MDARSVKQHLDAEELGLDPQGLTKFDAVQSPFGVGYKG